MYPRSLTAQPHPHQAPRSLQEVHWLRFQHRRALLEVDECDFFCVSSFKLTAALLGPSSLAGKGRRNLSLSGILGQVTVPWGKELAWAGVRDRS